MSVLLHSIQLPLLTAVRPGAIRHMDRLLAGQNLCFSKALVLTGPGPTARIAARVARELERAGSAVRVQCVAEPTYDEVDRIKAQVIESFYPDLLLAVGGGTIVDVTKSAAADRRLPWLSVPTAASNDGFCSPVVVLFANNTRKSTTGTMPIGVIADLDVLTAAPARLRRAGVGDLLSNLTASLDWQLAADRGKASPNGLARMLAMSGTRQMLGQDSPDLDNPGFVRVVVEGLILSGVAMEVYGSSRPCSGSEHLISHRLDALGISSALHGEQVAVATLLCAQLHGEPTGPIARFMARLGLPTSPEELGIDRAAFIAAAHEAPRYRAGRWTILSQRRITRAALARACDEACVTD